MKAKVSEEASRVLMLLKLDSKNLNTRLQTRKDEYLSLFAAKRSREHFAEVFFNRYNQAGIKELASCSLETITALDQFYTEVEELHWYVMHTEDMPATVEETVTRKLKRIENFYATLQLYLEAELGINQESSVTEETIPESNFSFPEVETFKDESN